MGTSLAELILLGAAAYGLYRLLTPLQRFLERTLLSLLSPGRKPVIDVTPRDPKEKE